MRNYFAICVVIQSYAAYTCHIKPHFTAMSLTTQTRNHSLGTKTTEDVAKALRIEQARRQLNGVTTPLHAIHAEWLEEKAKEVLSAA